MQNNKNKTDGCGGESLRAAGFPFCEVVKSCAGSGKTRGLIERLSALLLGGAQPGEILAITYTNKAAAEIYERLLLRLRAEKTPEAERILRRVMLRESPRDDLTVNTFHGWFMTLIRHRRWSDGRNVPGRLCEAGGLDDIKAAAWRGWLAKTESRALSPQAQTVLSHISPSGLQKMFFAFAGETNAWRLFDGGVGEGEKRAAKFLQKAECKTAAMQSALREAAERFLADGGGKKEGELHSAARAILAGAKNAEEIARAAACTKTNEIRKKWEKHAAACAFAESVFLFFVAREEREAAQFNCAALALCGEFAAEAENVKREKNIITFDDLEYQAWLAVVAEGMTAEITYRLSRRYRHILIDEFQDTSPMQWAIVRKWLLDAHGGGGEPSVYIVGDRKQAIYGFRHGNPELLDSAAEFLQSRYDENAQAREENISRRCAPLVLDFVNRVFTGGMRGFVAHRAAETNAKLPGFAAFTVTGGGETEKDKKEKRRIMRNPLITPAAENRKREMWAEEIAKTVAGAIGEWEVCDGGDSRPCAAGDMLILLPQMTHAELITGALAKRGIGCETSGGGAKLADRFACADLLDIVAVLLFPGRDLPLARALKSPVFSLSDGELQKIAAARGKKTLWQSLRENKNASAAVFRAFDLLARWRERARKSVLPAADILHSIIAEGDVFSRYRAAVPAHLREGVCADIDALLDWSLTAEGGNRPLLPQFYAGAENAPPPAPPIKDGGGECFSSIKDGGGECFSSIKDGEGEEHSPSIKDGVGNNTPPPSLMGGIKGGGGVRLYTVHQAKGLQAPVVILADSDFDRSGGKGDSADIFVDWPAEGERPRNFVARLRAHKTALEETAQKLLAKENAEKENLFAPAAEKKKKERAEKENLFYVAMTRAQQALLIFACEKPKPGTPAERALFAMREMAGGDDKQKTAAFGEMPRAKKEKQATHSLPSPESAPQTPPQKTTVGKRLPQTPEIQRGLQQHKLLALSLLGLDAKIIARLAAAGEKELRAAQKTAQSPQLQKLLDGCEEYFVETEIVFAGRILRPDLIVVRGGEAWVVDYKSGAADPSLHRAQLESYCAAVASLHPGVAVRAAILTPDGEMKELSAN